MRNRAVYALVAGNTVGDRMRKIEYEFHAKRYTAAGASANAFEPDGDATTISAPTPAPAATPAPAQGQAPVQVPTQEQAQAANPANAQAQEPAPPPEPPPPFVVPAGTTVPVILATSISSYRNKTGEDFEGNLAAPITVNGETGGAEGREGNWDDRGGKEAREIQGRSVADDSSHEHREWAEKTI